MIVKGNDEIRKVYGIEKYEKQRIIDFLQGAVYCWCKNRKDEWFSLRDLMGGVNSDWNGTPLIVLYNKHEVGKKNDPDKKAEKEAGKEGGWILKQVIKDDVRRFETKKEDIIRKYRWIPL